jgi:hypothetical protein
MSGVDITDYTLKHVATMLFFGKQVYFTAKASKLAKCVQEITLFLLGANPTTVAMIGKAAREVCP